MSYYWNKPDICRWCGMELKPNHNSQFCTPAHKQAHHRAYKKYVTRNAGMQKARVKSKQGSTKPSNDKG